MGNSISSPSDGGLDFPGSAVIESFNPCGGLSDTEPSPKGENRAYLDEKLFEESEYQGFDNNDADDREDISTQRQLSQPNRASAMLAKALVNEVTNNPNTMRPVKMAERELKLMKAQKEANIQSSSGGDASKIIGIPGGVGRPSVLGSIANALTGHPDPLPNIDETRASVFPPNSMSQNRAQIDKPALEKPMGRHSITIGLCLSRRSSVGNDGTVTRQTAFDFNELQDREYTYVSSTDAHGWRAGGGEPGGTYKSNPNDKLTASDSAHEKLAAPDVAHIPIIRIDAESAEAINNIIAVLASGDIFIPHMAMIPEALGVEGVSPPNLVVRFGTERNEDFPPDQWTNWCLEFMHNQLFEYFQDKGAVWSKRPFSITLSKEVRWKTVKHMNKYFANAEKVIDAWREKGPQFLDPQLAYTNNASIPVEVARPHGIYLFRDGIPTNYFAPNFHPPYTTNMTRNLLLNVLNKSWDWKRREWTSQPIPRLVTPIMLVAAMLGCTNNMAGGFVANEVTVSTNTADLSILPDTSRIRSNSTVEDRRIESVENVMMEKSSPKKKSSLSLPPTHSPLTRKRDESRQLDNVEETKDEMMDSQSQRDKARSLISRIVLSEDDDSDEGKQFEDVPLATHADLIADLQLFMSSQGDDVHANESKQTIDNILMDSPVDQANSSMPIPMNRQTSHATDVTDKQTNLSSAQQQLIQSHQNKGNNTGNQGSAKIHLISDDDWFDDTGETILTPMAVNNEVTAEPPVARTESLEEESTASYSIVFEDQSEEDMSDCPPMERDDVKKLALTSPPAEETVLTIPVPEPEKPPTSPDSNKNMESQVEMRQDMSDAMEDRSIGARDLNSNNEEREQPLSEQENCYPLQYPYGKQQTNQQLARKRGTHPDREVLRNNSALSALSLEYSMDSTNFGDKSAFTQVTQQSSLLGQHLSEPSRQLVQHQTKSLLTTTIAQEAGPEDIVQTESEDSSEIIPSDVELFNVGWAKAFDQNSGSYYYFTLDRSNIVWENPLVPGSIHTHHSLDTAESSSLIA